MSRDIVERLRTLAWCRASMTSANVDAINLVSAAADEIERLEKLIMVERQQVSEIEAAAIAWVRAYDRLFVETDDEDTIPTVAEADKKSDSFGDAEAELCRVAREAMEQ